MLFEVGDKVRLSSAGRQKYHHSRSNPYYVIGVIESTDEKVGYPIRVSWRSLTFNTYNSRELALVL